MSASYVHPTALVETDQIGSGTRVWAFAHVMRGAQVGTDCNIGEHCFVESGCSIGNGCTIKNGNMIWEGVTIEDGVFVGPSVHLTNDLYPRSPRLPEAKERYKDRADWLVPTLIKKGASLGAGSVIVCGITIGEYAMVAAGAVATKNIPPYALVKGNPARVCGWVCECGRPLGKFDDLAACSSCNQSYKLSAGSLQPLGAYL